MGRVVDFCANSKSGLGHLDLALATIPAPHRPSASGMTRQKVADDKRKRTAQACDHCKRRKQKCSGARPCTTCEKRQEECTYATSSAGDGVGDPIPAEPSGSPTKRRRFDETSPFSQSPPDSMGNTQAVKSEPVESAYVPAYDSIASYVSLPHRDGFDRDGTSDNEYQSRKPDLPDNMANSDSVMQDLSAASTPHMMFDLFRGRMLVVNGHPLYLGDTSTLAFLELVRHQVANLAGDSEFVSDGQKFNLLEQVVYVPANISTPCSLPDKETTHALLRAFFDHTRGLFQILDDMFLNDIERFFNGNDLGDGTKCLLFLALAIGLVLATPTHTSQEAEIDKAEVYFKSAFDIYDLSRKKEEKHFWNLQACALLAIYKLATSRRDQADDHMRAAVSLAYALGLHTDYPERLWNVGEVRQRRHMWRSLFILERMLSALMGRPMAIAEDQCSEKVLRRLEVDADTPYQYHFDAMDAAVETSRLIGRICKKISKVPLLGLETIRSVAGEGANWQANLPSSLHWREASAVLTPGHRMAILHVNLLHHYLIIMICRPLYAYVLYAHTRSGGREIPKTSDRAVLEEAFCKACCDACIQSSIFSIELIHQAQDAGYLSRRNPFVLNFLFTASLMLLCNEFFQPPPTRCLFGTVDKGIQTMEYCAMTEPQARKLLSILTKFKRVADERSGGSRHHSEPDFLSKLDDNFDPMAELGKLTGSALSEFSEKINEKKRRAMDMDSPEQRFLQDFATRAGPTPRNSVSEQTTVFSLASSFNSIGFPLSSMTEASLAPRSQNVLGSSMIRMNPVPTTNTSLSPDGSSNSDHDKFESANYYHDRVLQTWVPPGTSRAG